MKTSKELLKSAAVLSFAPALFQAIVSTSSSWSRYFGAWENIVSKPRLLFLSGFMTAVIFALFWTPSFVGSRLHPADVFLARGSCPVGTVFVLRGLFLVPGVLSNAGYIG